MPLTAGPSSSPVMRKPIEPCRRGRARRTSTRPRPPRRRRPSCRRRRGPRAAPRRRSPRTDRSASARNRPEARRRCARRRREFGAPRSEAGVEIEHVRRSRRREGHELGGKSGARENFAQIGQRAGVVRGHRRKGDQRAGDVERGRRGGWHYPPLRSGGGGPPAGRWRGRAPCASINAAAMRTMPSATSSTAAITSLAGILTTVMPDASRYASQR